MTAKKKKSSQHRTPEQEQEKTKGRRELCQLGSERENSKRKWKMQSCTCGKAVNLSSNTKSKQQNTAKLLSFARLTENVAIKIKSM